MHLELCMWNLPCFACACWLWQGEFPALPEAVPLPCFIPALVVRMGIRRRYPVRKDLLLWAYADAICNSLFSIREIAQSYQDMEQELAHAVNASSKSMDKVYAKSKSTEVLRSLGISRFVLVPQLLVFLSDWPKVGLACLRLLSFDCSDLCISRLNLRMNCFPAGPELQPCCRDGE